MSFLTDDIPVLTEMPKQERSDELEAYIYPENFQNRLFIYDTNYIYFRQTTYEILPIGILNELLPKLRITETSQNPEPIDFDQIEKFIEEKVDNHTQVLNNIVERLNIPTKLNEIIDQRVNTLLNAKYEEFINNINLRLEEFSTRLHEVSNPLTKEVLNPNLTSTDVLVLIEQELNTVYTNMKSLIADEVKKQPTPILCGSDIAELKRIPFPELLTLKHAGFTVAEITQLLNNNLL